MNDTPSNFHKRGRVVQFYAILSLLFIGIFTYTISNGGLVNTLSKIRQMASVSLSGVTTVIGINKIESTTTTSSTTQSDVFYTTPAVVATTTPTVTSTTTNVSSTTNPNESVSTENSSGPIRVVSATTTSTTTKTVSATNTTVTPPVVTEVLKTTEESFLIDKKYESNLNIFPSLYKDNVRIYDNISGIISIRVELPTAKAALLIGNQGGWMTGGVMRDGSLFKRIENTNRFVYEFDTRKYADGAYKVGAAYFDINRGWVLTSVYEFSIKNKIEEQVKVATTTASTTAILTTQALVNTQIAKLDTAKEKPALRLVVNDRQITDIKHIFNSEELELRVTTFPAASVQFFAYAEDGAFKPALKEIGKGGKDELLSRDGKEVWTYTTDMDDFPTGNFRMFARVKYVEGTIGESQPIAIVVQHLNQIKNTLSENSVATNTYATSATKESILQRVSNPSDCQNRQECEVFCSNTNSASGKCLEYVRSNGQNIESDIIAKTKINQDNVIANFANIIPDMLNRVDGATSDSSNQSSSTETRVPEYSGRPSILDIIPSVVAEKLVASKELATSDLPSEVKSVSDLQQYCGIVEHENDCVKTITKIAPELKANIDKQVELVRASEDKTRSLLEQRTGARAYIDSDGDGISDFDEVNFYHTDPTKRDSNGDGFSDGAAILGQMSAVSSNAILSASSSNIILGNGVYVESPKITGSTQSAQFKITEITAADVKENSEGKKEVSKIALKGVALPNSFVKIFLFSEPVVVTVKTDDNGNWSYVLDKTLPDGTHTAYVAMADGGGRILAKSNPLPFVKEASAITVNEANVGGSTKTTTFMGLSPITLIALLVGILGLALSVVGVVIGFRSKNEDTPTITLPQ